MQLILIACFSVFLTLRRCILLSMCLFSRLIDGRERWNVLIVGFLILLLSAGLIVHQAYRLMKAKEPNLSTMAGCMNSSSLVHQIELDSVFDTTKAIIVVTAAIPTLT